MTEMLGRMGNDRRVMIGVVGVALAVAMFGVTQWLTRPTWVPAATGVELALSGQLTARLDEAGIPNKLDRGGSDVMVQEQDLAAARVALARDGLATGSRPGLELFDQQTWGWNDFTQRVNYRRALEGELERTIGRMGGVDRASVHIAIGERAAFRRSDAKSATASVVLSMRNGQAPSAEVVRGIAQLVSSSVDGLESDQVSVHDVSGRLWSEPNDGSSAVLSARQLRMQQEIEHYLEQKAEAIVADVVGAGNSRIRVSAALNFDRIERTTLSVDPARQAIAQEQKAEIIPGAEGGAASSNVANSYETSKSTEVYSGAVGGIERLTVAVVVNEVRRGANGNTQVVRRSPAELQQLESLVRGAIGLDDARGDGITVVGAPFETVALPTTDAAVPESGPGVVTLIERYQRPALNLVGIGAMAIIALMTLNAIRNSGPGAPTAALASGGNATATASLAAGEAAAPAASPAPSSRPAPRIVFPEADTQVRDRVTQTVEKDPDSAARLVKSWLKEG